VWRGSLPARWKELMNSDVAGRAAFYT